MCRRSAHSRGDPHPPAHAEWTSIRISLYHKSGSLVQDKCPVRVGMRSDAPGICGEECPLARSLVPPVVDSAESLRYPSDPLHLTRHTGSVIMRPLFRGVAQSGSALEWGSSGPRFKSARPDLRAPEHSPRAFRCPTVPQNACGRVYQRQLGCTRLLFDPLSRTSVLMLHSASGGKKGSCGEMNRRRLKPGASLALPQAVEGYLLEKRVVLRPVTIEN
jgi:hypothetical protein